MKFQWNITDINEGNTAVENDNKESEGDEREEEGKVIGK